jgi:hypothetical protein
MWIVSIKGWCDEPAYEISVVKQNNEHGLKTYGWFDENKLLITHNGAGRVPMEEIVWNRQMKLAKDVADLLNSL